MHHTLSDPRTGSIVALHIGDTLELHLRQRAAGRVWQVTLRPYGMDLLEDSQRVGTSGRDATRRLMFRAMLGAGGILRLEEADRTTARAAAPGGAPGEHLDLLVTVAPAHATRCP